MSRFRILPALGLLLALGACARLKAPAASTDVPHIATETYTLPNGLKVILSEDHRLPMVAVNIWYHVGPANEERGRTGFAHLFEHMMFEGSKHVEPRAHFRLLEAAGASDYNGTTDFDRTNYYETLPSNQLELALWLESDRMGYLLDVLDRASLANQQDVVRNERRQNIENIPYGIVQEEEFHQLFPASHPYHANVIGSHADIQAATFDDVKHFFETYYRPNNASLAIVGDFDRSATKTLIEKYFGPLQRGPEVPKITASTPAIQAEHRSVVTDKVPLPKVYLGWLTPAAYKPGDADADLTAQILGGGQSSRLYKKLVYEQQIAQDVSAYQESLSLGSVFTITATARGGHTAAELEKAIDAELSAFQANGPTPQELERARNTFETSMIGGLETLGGVADLLNRYNQYVGTPDYLSQDLQRYRTATIESVKGFAAAKLAPGARVIVEGVPGAQALPPEVAEPPAPKVPKGTGTESVNADEAWRAKPPAAGPAVAPHIAVPASFTLSNGLTVILSERKNLPIVSMALVVKTGSDANPPSRPGLANFTVAMLDQGTATRNALQLADAAAQIGTTIGTTSSMDSSRVSIRALEKNAPAALDLLSDVVLHPSFPAEEIERQRARRLTQIVERRSDPSAAATTVMAAALYGASHPYGNTELGTEASVKSATRDDMSAFWKQNFVPNNAALVVAGAINAAELKRLAEHALGGWSKGTPAAPALGQPQTTSAKLVLVDLPGTPQTELRVAAIGVPRSTPDYAPLEVMDMILGGLFSSRINLNLRQDHGYTYGAYALFQYRKGAGPFFVTTGVRTNVTGPAVAEIIKELSRMQSTPISQAELDLGRDALVRSLPGAFETTQSTVGTISGTYVYDLGLDYYTKYPAQIGAVTIASVQDVAKRYLTPGRFVVIAAGDRAKIEPQLKKLNLGPVEIRDADGNPIAAKRAK
jgi:zinc protease